LCKTKLHLKREIHLGNPAFQKVLSDTSDKKSNLIRFDNQSLGGTKK